MACRAMGWCFGLNLNLGFSLTALSIIHCSLTVVMLPAWCQLIITGVLGHIELYVMELAEDRPLTGLPRWNSAMPFLLI